MAEIDEITERLNQLFEDRGRTAFAKSIGMPESTLRSYLDGTTMPLEAAARIAAGANVPLDWLAYGIGPSTGQNLAESGAGIATATTAKGNRGGFSFIPRYTVRAAAGNGLAVLEEDEVDRLAFRTDWLRSIGVNAAYCGLVTACGDSQEPTIPNNSIMLIDMSPDQQIRSGSFYVILVDGDLLVKRINRRTDGAIELLSDNPSYPKEVIPPTHLDRLNIPGRVAWIGRTV